MPRSLPELPTRRAVYQFANVEVRPEDGKLVRNGYDVPLQDQPFRLLVLLVSRPGAVVTREEIQAHLWPANTNVEFDKSLRVAVSKLREALRDSAGQPAYIETLPRRGYRFMMPVTVIEPSAHETITAAAGSWPEASLPLESSAGVTPSAGPGRVSVLAWPLRPLIVCVAIALVGSVAFLLLHRRTANVKVAPLAAAPYPARRSVAVIGLRNLSGFPSDDWLSTGLAEMLSTELFASQGLRVISGEEVARAGLSEAPANTPSRESLIRDANQLGADIILYGSYTLAHTDTASASSQMRLDLRVEDISAAADSISLVKTGRANDLFSLISATGADLRRHFGLGEMTLDTATAVRRTLPSDPEAGRLYAEGLSRLRSFDAPGGRDLLRRAAQIESGHAGIHLALADAWHAMGYEREAKAEAARAVELGAGLPREELLAMQAQLAVLSRDWPRAIEIYHSLIILNPDDIETGLRLVAAESGAGHFSDAMTSLKSQYRPGMLPADEARLDLAEATADGFTGNFRQSIGPAEKAIALAKELGSHLLRARALAIEAYSWERLGDSARSLAASMEAQDLYRAAHDKRGLAAALLLSGDVLYDKGQTANARKNFLSALTSFREVENPYDIGVTLERVGNTYYDEGSLVESRAYYQQALSVYRELHVDANIGSAIGNIANVQDAEGDIRGALEGNAECLALAEKAGDQRQTASTLANMGALEMERGSLDRASEDYTRAAAIDRQIAYTRGLSHALVGEGDVLVERNDILGALRQYDLGAKVIEGMDQPEVRVPALIGEGLANVLLGHGERASEYLKQAADTAVENKEHELATVALVWLSRALLLQGKIPAALDAAHHAVAESQAQVGPQDRSLASLALARVMLAQGNMVAAQAEMRTALVLAQRYGYLPLEMELRILLTRTMTDPIQRRAQLSAVTKTADAHGWKRIASDARSDARSDVRRPHA